MAQPGTTGRVMVTVKADSKEKAIEIGRSLPNFKLDETSDPISFETGKWIIFGTVTSGGNVAVDGDVVDTADEHEATTQDDEQTS